jgi:HD-like signal output (HDOD) protein/nitrogen-specific signal transduction histidine kinase
MDSQKIIASLKLPTLSKTLLEILEVEKKNPISFLDDIKKIIEKDPLLSAHVLKVANSSFYGFSHKIRTITQAVGLLGIRKIKAMAFSFSIFDFLKRLDHRPVYGGTFNSILKKSLLTSACSTILAAKVDYKDSEELYISGLLAEIGEILFFLYSPHKYSEIYSVLDKKIIPGEIKLFNIDHVTLGVEFCKDFNLPDFFKTAVENHFQLQEAEERSKIIFIANQITELLLTEDESEKAVIFKELENHTKKLLHLSLCEIEGAVRQLPGIMESFTSEFPEMQKDLKKIVETGAAMIIVLMKQEMEMIVLTRELTDTQKRMAKEKMFLSHMLNLSYFLSSLVPPLKLISSLFEYFENFIQEFTIEFIYRIPENGNYIRIKQKNNTNGSFFDIEKFTSLVKSKISNEAVRLEKEEMNALGKDSITYISLVFPISYHHNFFGFLILDVEKKDYFDFDPEMTYVQILSNIIANSFQNYLSFEAMKNESNKKKLVTNELLDFDKKLNHSKETVIELQKTEVMGELLPVIFHKLKNKLTPILGYSQILLSKIQDPAVNEKLKKIEKNANELTTQLNMLRDYFKTKKVSKEKDNLNRIISHLKPYFEEIETTHKINIIPDTDHSIPDDLLNPGQIETLITNIVNNSILSIKEKTKDERIGKIEIKTENMKDGYKLIIKDNGIGIPEENISRIWSPFYSTFPDRSGIGLTVCEKIIQNHNASHMVRSAAGQFTEFEISFTRAQPEEKPLATDVFKLDKDVLPGKILIVDDEAYLVDLMKEILQTAGNFDIVTTTSGKEAIRLIDNHFDLVISDIRMPEVSGMDIYELLKSRNMESKVIIVTADPYSEDVSSFLEMNKIDYLKKPFELMKFKQMVLEKLS